MPQREAENSEEMTGLEWKITGLDLVNVGFPKHIHIYYQPAVSNSPIWHILPDFPAFAYIVPSASLVCLTNSSFLQNTPPNCEVFPDLPHSSQQNKNKVLTVV